MNESVKRKESASNSYVNREIDWKTTNNRFMLAETNLKNSQKGAEEAIGFARQAQDKFK
jgi:hypothetical protein